MTNHARIWKRALAEKLADTRKSAFIPMTEKQGQQAPGPGGMPVDPAAGGAPMDPMMAGGAPPMGGMPPMDPMMAGGAPPMDPAMGGMPPMDPAMGGMPPMDPGMDPMAGMEGLEELPPMEGEAPPEEGGGDAQVTAPDVDPEHPAEHHGSCSPDPGDGR